MKGLNVFGLPLVLAMLFAGAATAADLAKPDGPVVLTVAGNIEATNRPAFDAFEDGFLNYHEKRFDKAAAFDRAMLEDLGLQRIEVGFETWPRTYRFEGPRLTDVLAAVGAADRTVTLFALDGYGVQVTPADRAAQSWVLALTRDGAPLHLGQRGPIWALYAPPGGRAATHDDEARWVWSVFYIEVE